MRALYLFLAGCWTATSAPIPPTPVGPAPIGPPAGATVVTVDAMDAGDPALANEQPIEAAPPWESIRTGRTDSGEIVLVLEHTGKHYTTSIGAGNTLVTGAFVADVLPGGPRELVLQVDHNNDGGKSVDIVVCGIGASGVPSCGTADVAGVMDLNEQVEVKAVRSGGVRVVHDGKTHVLWFEFP